MSFLREEGAAIWEMLRGDGGVLIAVGMWVVTTFMGFMFVALVQTAIFAATHTCVRARQYWGQGRYVGVVGRGGYFQPAGWRSACYEWAPNDGKRPWIVD